MTVLSSTAAARTPDPQPQRSRQPEKPNLLKRANEWLPILLAIQTLLVVPCAGFVWSQQNKWAEQDRKNAVYDQLTATRGAVNDKQDQRLDEHDTQIEQTKNRLTRIEEKQDGLKELFSSRFDALEKFLGMEREDRKDSTRSRASP